MFSQLDIPDRTNNHFKRQFLRTEVLEGKIRKISWKCVSTKLNIIFVSLEEAHIEDRFV